MNATGERANPILNGTKVPSHKNRIVPQRLFIKIGDNLELGSSACEHRVPNATFDFQ